MRCALGFAVLIIGGTVATGLELPASRWAWAAAVLVAVTAAVGPLPRRLEAWLRDAAQRREFARYLEQDRDG